MLCKAQNSLHLLGVGVGVEILKPEVVLTLTNSWAPYAGTNKSCNIKHFTVEHASGGRRYFFTFFDLAMFKSYIIYKMNPGPTIDSISQWSRAGAKFPTAQGVRWRLLVQKTVFPSQISVIWEKKYPWDLISSATNGRAKRKSCGNGLLWVLATHKLMNCPIIL